MDNWPSLCAVVVTYNRVEALKVTVEHYMQSPVSRLVVVDNASTDDTENYLAYCKECHSNRIHIMRLDENSGGAGGFYHGLKYARDKIDADWVILSDDDSYPAENTLEVFRNHVSFGAYGSQIVASAVRFPSGGICPMNRPLQDFSFVKYLSNLLQKNKASGVPDHAYAQNDMKPILASSFVGMFIPVDRLRETGVLPCADYFLYWDDISFCLDMRALGCNSVFDPRLNFYHDCSRKAGSITGERFYYLVRNGLRTFSKLPFPVCYIVCFLKGTAWLFEAFRIRSFLLFVRAIRDV